MTTPHVLAPFADIRREVRALRPELDEAIARVLDHGRFLLDVELEAFEHEFAAWLGVENAIGVSSGTDAIAVALLALGIRPGDEVITQANTCAPTAHGIILSGATVRLADCDPETLMLSLSSTEQAIGPRTRAIVPVHLYGAAADMSGVRRLADAYGLAIVEDCSHAIGTLLHGGVAGTFGDAAAFSFYPTKNLGAYGDGGCVVTRRADVAERSRAIRQHGMRARDVSSEFGFTARLDELQAAILRVKLPRVHGWNDLRRLIAAAYRKALDGLPVDVVPEPAHVIRHSYHLFPIRVAARDEFRARLIDHGVQTLVHYPVPLHLQPALESLGYARGDFPAAESACTELVSLPIFPYLAEEEQRTVVAAVRQQLVALH